MTPPRGTPKNELDGPLTPRGSRSAPKEEK
jgi:hypothetical protein